jgi:hypothetical protein
MLYRDHIGPDVNRRGYRPTDARYDYFEQPILSHYLVSVEGRP